MRKHPFLTGAFSAARAQLRAQLLPQTVPHASGVYFIIIKKHQNMDYIQRQTDMHFHFVRSSAE